MVSFTMLAAGVAASEDDLARFEATGADDDRAQFLEGMHALVLLWCAWAEPYVERGEPAPAVDKPLRDGFVGLHVARNRITGYDPDKARAQMQAAEELLASRPGCR